MTLRHIRARVPAMDKTQKKKILIVIPADTIAMIDDYRASERPVRNRNAAILSLIAAGANAIGVVRNG